MWTLLITQTKHLNKCVEPSQDIDAFDLCQEQGNVVSFYTVTRASSESRHTKRVTCIQSIGIHSGSTIWYLPMNKKLSYRRGTARCVVSVEILPIATQQCRNYMYKSWLLNKSKLWSWKVKVGRCVTNMYTQPWHEYLSLSYRCHKQTDDGRVVYFTRIPTTCCGEIF